VADKWLHPLGYGVNIVLEVTFVLVQLAVIMAFLVLARAVKLSEGEVAKQAGDTRSRSE
jgi:hypothetical protein